VANENAVVEKAKHRSIDIEPEDFVRFIERLCEAHRTNEGKVTFVVECPEDASLAGRVADSWLMRKNNPATGVPVADPQTGPPLPRPSLTVKEAAEMLAGPKPGNPERAA
jgi:hypothetical protein